MEDMPKTMTVDYSCMPKILIVDDAEFSRGRMMKALGNAGYSVIEAGNGVEAVSRYRDEKPDVVLMDINILVIALKVTLLL